jgi:hypothetical protein
LVLRKRFFEAADYYYNLGLSKAQVITYTFLKTRVLARLD